MTTRTNRVHFASHDELLPLRPAAEEEPSVESPENNSYEEQTEPGINATIRASGYTKKESMEYHFKSLSRDLMESFRGIRNHMPSERSQKRARLNIILGTLLILALLTLSVIGGVIIYNRIYLPIHKDNELQEAIRKHAEAARIRAAKCIGISWEMACDNLGAAGARRKLYTGQTDRSSELEEQFLNSDDPTVTYDEHCLRVYRLNLLGNITFPYHASQLLHAGGNYTMALFIQHGALRNAQDYFCSFKQLMLKQKYRNFEDILIIAPYFNYEHDELVHPQDAFWNSSKPWGDWRVGAESDPRCCGNQGHRGIPRTISSFEVLDNMLAMLTSKKLFPRMNKISYVGHSAGGQMVQRYAIMSTLAALWDLDEDVDVAFIIANPSSYTYLTPYRYHYSCGNCICSSYNCTCDSSCTKPPYTNLSIPTRGGATAHHWPCYEWNYNGWPYGLSEFTDMKGHFIPYALRDGSLGVERALRLYQRLHVVYLVGQNDTCNDGLPACDASCWKRDKWEVDEWRCFRNQMDTRCPAMLQGPCRRTRGYQYMSYLEDLYGKPTHAIHTVPGIGHNASGMFGSDIGMLELFGPSHQHK